MKLSINKNYKLWIIITAVVLVVGIALLAIFNFNQTADYKASYEAVVDMDNQNSLSQDGLSQYADEYLQSKGISAIDHLTQEIDYTDGHYALVYKFDKDVKINQTDMATYIQNKATSAGFSVVIEVQYNNVDPFYTLPIGWICLGLGLATLAIFIYLLIMEKLASSIAVICSSALSALLFVALLATTRIPSQPFAYATMCLAFALTTFVSTGIVNRFKEQLKLNQSATSSEDKLSFEQIADKGVSDSLLRLIFIFGGLLLTCILLISIGSIYIKFLGVQLLIAIIASAFASICILPTLWPLLKNFKKKA